MDSHSAHALSRIALLAALVVSLTARDAPSQVVAANPEELKGAFLYNFAKFVEWPPEAFAATGENLVICVEPGSFADVLEETIRDKQVGSRDVEILRWTSDAPLDGCNILYLESLDRAERDEVLRRLEGRSVLTVGDMKDFAEEGGIINFVRVEDRLRFEVNPAAADRAKLRISSKLMSLAQVVADRREEMQ